MHYTYVLISKSGHRTYTGCTSDLPNRMKEHNEGKVRSSSPYAPYEILHSEKFMTLKEARRKEAYFKSTSGRREIKQFIYDQSRDSLVI